LSPAGAASGAFLTAAHGLDLPIQAVDSARDDTRGERSGGAASMARGTSIRRFVMTLCAVSVFGAVVSPATRADPVLRYPPPIAHDPQVDYVLAVLQLAISEAQLSYTLKPASQPMVQSRVIEEIKANRGSVDILWTMTTPDRERDLLPIRIPIDRGLIGWRVALLPAARRDLLADVTTPAQLQSLRAGQMHDWPDTDILLANGMKVDTAPNYENLFKMLALRRFDYFPRSVIEVTAEQRAHPDLDLVIDPHLLIRYKAAFYFFISRQRPDLAAALERGLRLALSDGRFAALFHSQFDATLAKLDLAHRRVIDLANPLLPPDTPVKEACLWYDPAGGQ
jgi:hypothetical protein